MNCNTVALRNQTMAMHGIGVVMGDLRLTKQLTTKKFQGWLMNRQSRTRRLVLGSLGNFVD